MGHFMNMSGFRFGRLLAIKPFHNKGRGMNVTWECNCDCGKTLKVDGGALRSGNTKSCGCLKSELDKTRRRTHGMSRLPEMAVWKTMKQRCLNPNNKDFVYYGGRGITVCQRWLYSFQNFIIDMGRRPFADAQIDRMDNNGNYEPSNCQWATKREQGNNRRTNVRLTFNGQTRTQAEWGRILGFEARLIGHRLGLGWSIEKALTTAPLPKRKRS